MSVSNSARIFRLFVSSTFSDFIAEREALQKQVFPELETYCAKRGARFQAELARAEAAEAELSAQREAARLERQVGAPARARTA